MKPTKAAAGHQIALYDNVRNLEEKKREELDHLGDEPIRPIEPVRPSETEFLKTTVTITWQNVAQTQ